jgi:hypothetical protein
LALALGSRGEAEIAEERTTRMGLRFLGAGVRVNRGRAVEGQFRRSSSSLCPAVRDWMRDWNLRFESCPVRSISSCSYHNVLASSKATRVRRLDAHVGQAGRQHDDPWWAVSQSLVERCKAYDAAVVPVIGALEARDLDPLLQATSDTRVVVWVSGFEELMVSALDLATYARAIQAAAMRGQEAFALYGGFFHVLLGGLGLRGASHGIGYGEYRAWIELPQSGPPPARYYLRRVHRYVSQELAYQLYLRDRSLVECNCPECQGQPPIALDYHALMKHSVWARAEEIEQWSRLGTGTAADVLETEYEAFGRAVQGLRLPPFLSNQADRSYDHLIRWAEALRLV